MEGNPQNAFSLNTTQDEKHFNFILSFISYIAEL